MRPYRRFDFDRHAVYHPGMRPGLTLAMVLVPVLALPCAARAQYRNHALALDVGYWTVTRPSAVDPGTGAVYAGEQVPLRLAGGLRLGGESSTKLHEDHLWLTGRVSVGFLRFASGGTGPAASLDERFDAQAASTLGTIVGIEGALGVRWVFLTDRVRPYVQAGLSYLRLESFASRAGDGCDPAFCAGGSNEDTYLRHPNVLGLHAQPGLEIVVGRDVALHLFADVQRWVLLSAADNTAICAGLGLVFFT